MSCPYCNTPGCEAYCESYCPICDKPMDENEEFCSIDCKNENDMEERQLEDYIMERMDEGFIKHQTIIPQQEEKRMKKFNSIEEFIEWINNTDTGEVTSLLEEYGFEFEDWTIKDTKDNELIEIDEYKAAIMHSNKIVNSKGSAKDVKYHGRPLNNPFKGK